MSSSILPQVPGFVTVSIHRSQFPEPLERELWQDLAKRRVNPKFHYLSPLQSQRWLALSRAYAPISQDKTCRDTYDQCFAQLAAHWGKKAVHLVSLGCGSGQKDLRLVAALLRKKARISYTACDGSLPMVLAARQAVETSSQATCCDGLVCDIGACPELYAFISRSNLNPDLRLFLCFGVIPNFDPDQLFHSIKCWFRPGDYLLLGANLVPENDTDMVLGQILAQYDNDLTREWLLTLFQELGADPRHFDLKFRVVKTRKYQGLPRITATARVQQETQLRQDDRVLKLPARSSVQVFFSYRYTVSSLLAVLKRHGLHLVESWMARSGEEGLFLCQLTPLQEH